MNEPSSLAMAIIFALSVYGRATVLRPIAALGSVTRGRSTKCATVGAEGYCDGQPDRVVGCLDLGPSPGSETMNDQSRRKRTAEPSRFLENGYRLPVVVHSWSRPQLDGDIYPTALLPGLAITMTRLALGFVEDAQAIWAGWLRHMGEVAP